MTLLDVPSQFHRCPHIVPLRALVAAYQQHQAGGVLPGEIHSVARTVVDAKLRHSSSNRPAVTQVPQREAADSGVYPRTRARIRESCEPAAVFTVLPDLDRQPRDLQNTPGQQLRRR